MSLLSDSLTLRLIVLVSRSKAEKLCAMLQKQRRLHRKSEAMRFLTQPQAVLRARANQTEWWGTSQIATIRISPHMII